ncbi:hypothetical protein FQR65_LT02237 [Abscondita terminalis]|nr:hypothetical protein FQR65_LT02237 [Abscondita terminalis]
MEKNLETVDENQKKEIDWIVMKFIYGCKIPIEVVDSKDFKDLMKKLCPSYVPPNSKSLANKLQRILFGKNLSETEEDDTDSDEDTNTSNEKSRKNSLQSIGYAGPSKDVSPNLLKTVPNKNDNQTKNPVMLLNKLYPHIRFECLENNNDDYSRYKMIVTIGDDKFVGIGPSKRSAKKAAAAAALSKLSGKSETKFEKESCDNFDDGESSTTSIDKPKKNSLQLNIGDPGPSKDVSPNKNDNQIKNPANLLYVLYPYSSFECVEYSKVAYARFKVVVTINDDKFEGIGSNKKIAKNVAAAAALNKLLGKSETKFEKKNGDVTDDGKGEELINNLNLH